MFFLTLSRFYPDLDLDKIWIKDMDGPFVSGHNTKLKKIMHDFLKFNYFFKVGLILVKNLINFAPPPKLKSQNPTDTKLQVKYVGPKGLLLSNSKI